MKKSNKIKSAFTLLELLITLFIIAIIISLSVVVYDVSWSKSRNSKRVSDIIRIQNALESYHLQEGKYPDTLTFGQALIGESTSSPITYLAALPTNPTPRIDGDCADQEYQYSTSTDVYGHEDFFIEFCIGNNTDQIGKGINCATSQGIALGSCTVAINTYTLTYTAGAGGSIVGISPQTVNAGENGSEVLASPSSGYSFVNWSDSSTDNPRTDTNVLGDISVTANFSINTYTLTYTAGAGGSIVGVSPQTVNSGENGSAVTAVPDPGYDFDKWSDDSTANPRTDTNVTENISVTATFVDNGQNVFLGTTNNNWGTATNWSRGTIPASADGYTAAFNTSSPDCTVYNGGSAAYTNAIDFTGYTGTITMNASLYVYGDITLSNTMTDADDGGTRWLIASASGTLTSNGHTWAGRLGFYGTSQTFTLADDWTVTKELWLASITAATINGNTIYVGGDLRSSTTGATSGTTNIVMNGTGTWSNSSTGQLQNNLTFNTAGTITVSGAVSYNTGTLTYTAGTMITTGSALVSAASTTFDTDGMAWGEARFTGTSQTYTFTSDMEVATLSIHANSSTFTGSTIYCTNLTSTSGSNAVYGTTNVVMNGGGVGTAGTWTQLASQIFQLNLTFNTAGTITISGNVYYGAGTLTYIAGTIDTTGSTLYLRAGTFDVAGITWNNVTSQANGIYTLLGDLNVSGNFTEGNTSTTHQWDGLFNINVGGSLTCNMTSGIFSGSATIVMNGTGTFSMPLLTTGRMYINLTFNTAGTITISGTIRYRTKTITYASGTIITTDSTLELDASATLDTNGITWNNVTFTGTSATHTLTSNMDVNGTLTFTGTTAMTINGSTIYVGGNLTTNGVNFAGTTNLIIDDTCTIATSYYVGLSLTFNAPGETITLPATFRYGLAGGGNTLTYTAGTMVTAGSSLNLSTSATINTSGMTWNDVVFGGTSMTYTLTSDMDIDGTLTLSGGTATTLTGSTIYVGGSLTQNTTAATSGTTNIVMNGTGTWSNSSSGYLKNNLTFDTAGAITISGYIRYTTGTMTYTAGTVTATGAALICNVSTTFDTDGMIWGNVTWTGATTFTLLSDLTMNGNAILGSVASTLTINGSDMYVGGSLTQGGTVTTASITGTATIILNGTGTWSSTSTGTWNINVTINTAGTITLGTSIYGGNGNKTWTYTAGTIVNTGSTVYVGTCTLDLNGMTLNNFRIQQAGSSIVMLKSELKIAGLFNNEVRTTHQKLKPDTGQYPPEQSDTYVKATSKSTTSYWPYLATDPIRSLTGNYSSNSWLSANPGNTNQRFHIDLGEAKTINRIYYENTHHIGTFSVRGVREFTFWGSNSAADFADLVYANDGTWTQLTTDATQFDQHVASDIPDPKFITVTNVTPYRYYAFKFANNWGDASFMGVRRIELEIYSGQKAVTLLAGGTQDLTLVDAVDIDSSAGLAIHSIGGILSNTLNWYDTE